MYSERRLSATRNKLAWEIKKICCVLSLAGSLGGTMASAANPIARPSTHAFGIPDDVVQNIEIGLAITTIDGNKYIQFITATPQLDVFESTIAGPIDRLLDRTIPWEEVVYSRLSFNSSDINYPGGTLVDLDNDGINTLIIDTAEYAIGNSLQLLSSDAFGGVVDPYIYATPPEFIDVDGDSDLDMFIHDWKYGDVYFYENIGSTEQPEFDSAQHNVEHILDPYIQSLPPGFLDYFNSKFYYSFPSRYSYPVVLDFDSDGDMDLLMSIPRTNKQNQIKYFEQARQNGVSTYSEPFSTDQFRDDSASWMTDFDSDGDFDILTVKNLRSDGNFYFHERINSSPPQYANPVALTNVPDWIGAPDFFGAPFSYSISSSKGVFEDLDNDGYQEMLTAIAEDGDKFKIVLLRRREDNSFEQILVSQGNDIPYGMAHTLQFIDGNNDGILDIVSQFWDPTTGTAGPTSLFLHVGELNFTGPFSVDPVALELNHYQDNYLDIDFDGDGDIDRVYNHSITWNLESNPGSITNFSTRAHVGSGPDILIGGFIIEGESPQTVILRGIGPSLSEFGIASPLDDPELYLYSGQQLIASNDDWQSLEDADKIQSAGIAPTHPNEAALRVRLNPGAYTVHLKGKSGGTGVGIVAVDSDNQMPANSLQVNISSRALVNEGENLAIGGFVIEGDTPVKVLIRGLGPMLQEHGLDNPLADPNLTLFSGNTIIASNDDWMDNANASEIAALADAPTYDSEAAILTELEPGRYTVHLRGTKNDTGVGIIAIDRIE